MKEDMKIIISEQNVPKGNLRITPASSETQENMWEMQKDVYVGKEYPEFPRNRNNTFVFLPFLEMADPVKEGIRLKKGRK